MPIVGTYTSTKALSEPVSPMVYNGFCGYREMAQAGVGIMADKIGKTAPKVVTVAIESAGGKEYHDFVAEAIGKRGGTAHHVTMKVTAVDVTPQVLEIMNLKPDFITIYGVPNTAVLTMKACSNMASRSRPSASPISLPRPSTSRWDLRPAPTTMS